MKVEQSDTRVQLAAGPHGRLKAALRGRPFVGKDRGLGLRVELLLGAGGALVPYTCLRCEDPDPESFCTTSNS